MSGYNLFISMWKKGDGLNENANAFPATMALIEKKYRKK